MENNMDPFLANLLSYMADIFKGYENRSDALFAIRRNIISLQDASVFLHEDTGMPLNQAFDETIAEFLEEITPISGVKPLQVRFHV